jgi:hypothetical protein
LNSSGNKNTLANFYGIPIPILIAGSLQNPHVGLDSNEIAKALAQYQVQKVQSQIQDKIQGDKSGKVKAGELLQNLFGR